MNIRDLCNNVLAQANATVPTVAFPPVYELVIVLAAHWQTTTDLRYVLLCAGLDPSDYNHIGTSKARWAAAIERAYNREELPALLDAIAAEYDGG